MDVKDSDSDEAEIDKLIAEDAQQSHTLAWLYKKAKARGLIQARPQYW